MIKMKYIVPILIFVGCHKPVYKPTSAQADKQPAVCAEWAGTWWSVDFADSLVITFNRQVNDTAYYTGNYFTPYLKHKYPYEWIDDNLIINGHEFRLQH